jgi:hypothetical protein
MNEKKGPKRQRQTKGLATGVAPLHDIEEIFEVSVKKACGQGLEDALKYFEGRSIRVATMCSGTESPLLALNLIAKGELVLVHCFLVFVFVFCLFPPQKQGGCLMTSHVVTCHIQGSNVLTVKF